LTEEESLFTTEKEDRFIVEPLAEEKDQERFSYTSGTNKDFMDITTFKIKFEEFLK
jgi:virulence-associated protein VagC